MMNAIAEAFVTFCSFSISVDFGLSFFFFLRWPAASAWPWCLVLLMERGVFGDEAWMACGFKKRRSRLVYYKQDRLMPNQNSAVVYTSSVTNFHACTRTGV